MCSGSLCEAQIWKIRYSEQARQVKTVKAHSWIAKSTMGQTVGGTQLVKNYSVPACVILWKWDQLGLHLL